MSLYVIPYKGTPSAFDSTMYTSGRNAYLAQDPKASIRSRVVDLPAGTAVELIATLTHKNGSQTYHLSSQNYSFLHDGNVYEFAYIATSSTYLRVRSLARSIRFTS